MDQRVLARSAAGLLYGTPTVFADLAIGERFAFPTNARGTVCVKVSERGWYRIADTGQAFRTGRLTAVRPVEGK